MKKTGLIQLLVVVFLSLGMTGCVRGVFSSSEWLTFDGILIIVVFLFLLFYTLATMRSDEEHH
jgi:hypothetical protein